LECGGLPPLFRRELARVPVRNKIGKSGGQQAGLEESGSKLPRSKSE
jgi:hypothetical protein